VGRFSFPLTAEPAVSRDIWPMLRRAAGLFWVNRRINSSSSSYWSGFSTDWPRLAQTSNAAAALRKEQAKLLREIGRRRALLNFSLRPWQKTYLTAWENGQFLSDFDGTLPGAGVISADGLTRIALDTTAGQGFFPGIEAGIIVTNTTIYAEPFRIAPHLMPGDLTALMALPWQADFLECAGAWWPSQRPDTATPADDPNGLESWIRTIDPFNGHRELVEHFGKLGVVVPQTVSGNLAFLEVDRDPAFLA
jgi:hypothetical protein